MRTFEVTPRTRVRRRPNRAVYDRETVYAILDEGLICHVGFVAGGQPYVIPTIHARIGDRIVLHGSAASRMLTTLGDGFAACVTVTLLDGLVLARSAFHHSMNYRSVVMLGTLRPLTEAGEKRSALEAIVEHVVPGRSRDARAPNEQELRATIVLAMELSEVSAKVRSGGPIDDEEDMTLPVWAGVLPLRLEPAAPLPDEHPATPADVPDYVRHWSR